MVSGKNILLTGPPGSGKTSFITNLLDNLGFNYSVETGNMDWTPFDTIGGILASGEFKPGFITKVVEECVKSIGNDQDPKPKWVVIDEINRTNIDLALGKLFTLMDLEYRDKPLVIDPVGNKEYYVPYSFRVLATMNSYDRAILQKTGYALIRRFALLNHNLMLKLENYEIYSDKDIENFKNFISDTMSQNISINIRGFQRDKALKTLLLPHISSNKRFENDYGVIFEDIRDEVEKIVSGKRSISVNGVDMEKILLYLVNEINEKLETYSECEYCPVIITPGLIADMLRFLAVSSIIYDFLPSDNPLKDHVRYTQIALDFVLVTLAIPQLDILADVVKSEEYGETGVENLKKTLNELVTTLSNYGLRISSEFVKRIAKGHHVF